MFENLLGDTDESTFTQTKEKLRSLGLDAGEGARRPRARPARQERERGREADFGEVRADATIVAAPRPPVRADLPFHRVSTDA